ncbi:HAD hydrolase-like protein [Shimia sp. R9_3]|uniref:HAD family hydrolase n=1 Tax=Shimia sp. R9_3 TaxID=2821113 RepID=UPI001AD9ED84|nr:HAD hydrolase-like protein [Shimia sp. R9_3]MBO9399409.1 HAD family hydrolase [Shimia sp. R9_3]
MAYLSEQKRSFFSNDYTCFKTYPLDLNAARRLELRPFELANYDVFAFDFDGTLADTNATKYRAVYCAALSVTEDESVASRFAKKFIFQSGISREAKITAEFDEAVAKQVLAKYNSNLEVMLSEVVLDDDALRLIEKISEREMTALIVTGGDVKEVEQILERNQCADLFHGVFGPPLNKVQHFRNLLKSGLTAVYFGDSPYDAEACIETGVDFCFVEQFSHVDYGQIDKPSYSINKFGDILCQLL